MTKYDILNELVVIMKTCDTDTHLKLDKLWKEIFCSINNNDNYITTDKMLDIIENKDEFKKLINGEIK